jgi:recombinational DNA repair protein RecR
MNATTIKALARTIRADIDAHHKASNKANLTHDELQQAQVRTIEGRALATYLIQHLDSRHDATRLAKALGMTSYINLR